MPERQEQGGGGSLFRVFRVIGGSISVLSNNAIHELHELTRI
jgi:hypothetical protein